jgi:tetratricopeptide (TPR) repeat protein
MKASMSLSKTLLQKLDDALLARQIREGFCLLDRVARELMRLHPRDLHAAAYLLNLAQWVDLGYRDHHFIEQLLARFSNVRHANMKLTDFVQFRMSEAFLAFATEDVDKAISILAGILALEHEIARPRLIFVTHFWKGRAHRKKGEYGLAVQHILAAKESALKLQAPKLAAVVQIHESWLLFQRGERTKAFDLLKEAETELKPIGHSLSLGNIESARGRFVRRSGEYAKALEHFDRAIAIYSKHFPRHPNLARALVNAAYVKRLIALDLVHKITQGRARGVQHDKYLSICQEALTLLKQAEEIYVLQKHQSGIGAVLVNAGHLHLDRGDIDRASQEAIKAFQVGEKKQDHILMSRARILQANIKNLMVEEQVGEVDDLANHASMARRYSDEAVALAQQTQNKRLLAGAYIACGLTSANEFYEEWDVAKHFASLAGELLSPDDRDHLSKEILALKSRILRATGIDQTLRLWSDGLTGDKTFQQVTEEFAEIVIPKVWIREDRKVSRVAKKLSISPKKVRRILRNVQLQH